MHANAFFFCVSRFICMSMHPHCICLFALRAIIYTFRYFLHVFFLIVEIGQFLQLVILSSQKNLSGEFSEEQTGTTGLLRIECLVQQPKQTESQSTWQTELAEICLIFSAQVFGDFLRYAVFAQDATG